TCQCIFSLFFPDFLAIFGNVHRPCKQYPNIITNSECHEKLYQKNQVYFLKLGPQIPRDTGRKCSSHLTRLKDFLAV
ncbi:hypothetical protein K443DRAFT_628253, partial [Laccaria amethystina LaAM-08-1]